MHELRCMEFRGHAELRHAIILDSALSSKGKLSSDGAEGTVGSVMQSLGQCVEFRGHAELRILVWKGQRDCTLSSVHGLGR